MIFKQTPVLEKRVGNFVVKVEDIWHVEGGAMCNVYVGRENKVRFLFWDIPILATICEAHYFYVSKAWNFERFVLSMLANSEQWRLQDYVDESIKECSAEFLVGNKSKDFYKAFKELYALCMLGAENFYLIKVPKKPSLTQADQRKYI